MYLKNILSYKNELLIYAIILILINILLTDLPLTKTFVYEFSAVNGLLLCIISGLYTIGCINNKQNNLSSTFINIFILSAIPLAISIINSMFTMFCSFWDGLWFYILIVSGSVMFGSSVAFVINIV